MDEDIRENLKELGDHVVAVGRQIKSTKIDIDGLQVISETLKYDKMALDIYIRILIDQLAK